MDLVYHCSFLLDLLKKRASLDYVFCLHGGHSKAKVKVQAQELKWRHLAPGA